MGAADGLIDLLTPIQFNDTAPMRVETWTGEPPDDDENWDHMVDIDLDAPSGRLMFQESGEIYEPQHCAVTEIPAGRYRARISGRGYDHSKPQGGGLDSYRIQLWPRGGDSPPSLRRTWPGWAKMV